MYHDRKKGVLVLEVPGDLPTLEQARMYGSAIMGSIYREYDTPARYPHPLSRKETAIAITGMTVITGMMAKARQEYPLKYERQPTDIEVNYENGNPIISVKTPEQGMFVANLASIFMDIDKENIEVAGLRNIARGSGPIPLSAEISEKVVANLVMIARGNYDWDENDGKRCVIDGRPLTREVAISLLQEDLFRAGGIFGYPNHQERHIYLYDKYVESTKRATSDDFHLVQRAEGVI